MIIVALLIAFGVGYEMTSNKEPVQLKRQMELRSMNDSSRMELYEKERNK